MIVIIKLFSKDKAPNINHRGTLCGNHLEIFEGQW